MQVLHIHWDSCQKITFMFDNDCNDSLVIFLPCKIPFFSFPRKIRNVADLHISLHIYDQKNDVKILFKHGDFFYIKNVRLLEISNFL